MRPSDWFGYLFGRRQAILQTARSRNAILAGLGLAVLTGIARNYDQTFILEAPAGWLFGSLAFSLVSGTWLYLILYGFFTRRDMEGEGWVVSLWSGWRSFMGLFWLTAPIAWLYAIPVERYFEPVMAVKLNITLFAVVTLWRVLLMARVMQVLAAAPFLMTMVWVIFAAAVEGCAVVFLGGHARAVMTGTAGLWTSPEEEILISAMSTAFVAAFWSIPMAVVIGLAWRSRRPLQPLPEMQAAPVPKAALTVLAVVWVAAAILPQGELRRSRAVEQLIVQGQGRAALDYLARHRAGDFAPARPLAPRPYSQGLFTELPVCFAAVQPTDPDWVRQHLLQRLDQMYAQYRPRYPKPDREEEEQIKEISQGISGFGPATGEMVKLLDGLARLPEGRKWLQANPIFLKAVHALASEPVSEMTMMTNAKEAGARLALSNRVEVLRSTNAPAGLLP